MTKAVAVRATELASLILQSDDNYLDHVVELWKLGNELYSEGWTTEFHIFGVIESETDHLPLAHVRQRCSDRMLERSDKELIEIIGRYRKDVNQACNEILARWRVA